MQFYNSDDKVLPCRLLCSKVVDSNGTIPDQGRMRGNPHSYTYVLDFFSLVRYANRIDMAGNIYKRTTTVHYSRSHLTPKAGITMVATVCATTRPEYCSQQIHDNTATNRHVTVVRGTIRHLASQSCGTSPFIVLGGGRKFFCCW